MARAPAFHSQREQFEDLSTDQIFKLFESSCKTKKSSLSSKDLADAWGVLFSGVCLSAEELVNGMLTGQHPLNTDREKILCEFIRNDCKSGGGFVLEVARSGGKIDRAALIMIGDPENLAGVEHHGSTALHILAEACDRAMRPALISRAGKKALTELYDTRGMPLLFTIFGLKDLARDDLTAIGKMFTRDELRKAKVRNRTGKTGLELYSEASRRLNGREPDERNSFAAPGAVKNTNLRGQFGSRSHSGGRDTHLSGTDVMGENRRGDEGTGISSSERYDDLMRNPLDNFQGMVHRKNGPK